MTQSVALPSARFSWATSRLARLFAVAAILVLFAGAGQMSAQSTRRPRRESNASRKARIERTIAATYAHKYEVGGGGGYERFRSGQYQQKDNQVTFWMTGLYALNPKLGIQAEVEGGYGAAKIGNVLPSGNRLNFNPQISEYSFMAGPSYRVVSHLKFSASAFVEGGVGLGKFDGDSKGLSAANIGVWTGNYAASIAAGVHLDYNLSPNFAARVTPMYHFTGFGGGTQNNRGFNVGLVYRFKHLR